MLSKMIHNVKIFVIFVSKFTDSKDINLNLENSNETYKDWTSPNTPKIP